ncbi:wax ester/triacylglycerol synthase family O-acyltransferase [Nannocystis sp. SCPEA4]|uniref:WS/DGAT/MGAT family O-acyltransferase n=1 Tax=Nannocystis sp. SCPEA4 TaxID=2996787 RepID=UPI00226F4185|nr:wax ester/triacylglycerol synthase family O-acyltransferase [Nannocystis sp. SCPEA4]MCY1060943.1 wax ester/triacylglycerol synthase family O-acyltransferase [Nannocystis sp. SCPEA4]
MTGLDAGFLYMESPSVSMHTVGVMLVDVSNMRGGYTFERVRSLFERQIHLVPLLRRRVVEVPWNLHHPVWIEDPDLDLSRHLRRATLAPPGDERALESLVGEVLSTHMNRAHPLWEITVVEGLRGGRVALICKVHHAVIDGAAMVTVLERVMSSEYDASDVAPASSTWASEPLPSAPRLIFDALQDRLRGLFRLPRLVGRTARAGVRLLQRTRGQLSLPFTGPRASFNARLTSRRSFAAVDLPLADLKVLKAALGCTLNDVVLGIAAAGLRRCLDRRGEVHRRPLLASIPVATGGPEDARLGGNKVSSLLVSLRTDLADLLVRLREIHALTEAAKHAHELEVGGLLEQWTEYAHPWLVRLLMSRVLPRLPRPPVNLVISNVRGPTDTQYLIGASLESLYLGGPLVEQIGLNLTVWSYRETVHLAAVACPDVSPDPHVLLRDCEHALAELVAALQTGAASERRRPRRVHSARRPTSGALSQARRSARPATSGPRRSSG